MTSHLADLVDSAECPACGMRGTLEPDLAYQGGRVCSSCAGWFLARDAAYQFLVGEARTDTDEVARMLASPGLRKRRCPSCDQQMSAIKVQGEDTDLCPACGGAWLSTTAMAKLTDGRLGSAQRPMMSLPSEQPTLAMPAQGSPAQGLADSPTVKHLPSPSAPVSTSGKQPASPFGLPHKERPASPFGAAEISRPSAVPEPFVAQPVPAPFEAAPAPSPPEAPVDAEVAPRAKNGVTGGASDAAPSLPVGKKLPEGGAPLTMRVVGTSGAMGVARGARPVKLIALLAAGLVVGVVAAALLFRGGDDERAHTEDKSLTDRYATYLVHYRFGGRTVDWWGGRLTELSPGGASPDAKLYALTKERALKNGLVVDEHPGRVEVKLSQPLAARLLDRLEVK